MIQAESLRIGNWVSPIGDKPQQVRTIKEQKAKDGAFYTVNGFLVEHLQPVALSPDILEKCGFWTDFNYTERHFNNVIGCLEKSNEGYIFPDEDGENSLRYTLRHLHQLQNLYFALTGEELTLNL